MSHSHASEDSHVHTAPLMRLHQSFVCLKHFGGESLNSTNQASKGARDSAIVRVLRPPTYSCDSITSASRRCLVDSDARASQGNADAHRASYTRKASKTSREMSEANSIRLCDDL